MSAGCKSAGGQRSAVIGVVPNLPVASKTIDIASPWEKFLVSNKMELKLKPIFMASHPARLALHPQMMAPQLYGPHDMKLFWV